jgi:Transmembrane family, TMEM144 of transporters
MWPFVGIHLRVGLLCRLLLHHTYELSQTFTYALSLSLPHIHTHTSLSLISVSSLVCFSFTVFPQSIVPAFLSGAMWGVAQAFWLVANGTLGLTVAYPIVTLGPTIVSSLWSVLLFKEIRGRRNLILLGIAMLLNVACVLMVAFSQVGSVCCPTHEWRLSLELLNS